MWVICPKCLDAMEGEIGDPCIVCGTALQATPLSQHIAAKVRRDANLDPDEALIAELT